MPISTHTLRKEGDRRAVATGYTDAEFQPTPSARRVTTVTLRAAIRIVISTHTLRKEGDDDFDKYNNGADDFNPHPPQGG